MQRLSCKRKNGHRTDADAILAKITTGVKDICTDCDLIVEAALEVMDVKKQTFKELQDIVTEEDCILLQIHLLCLLQRSVQVFLSPVIGMHFFNPAPVMKLS
ncbi:MAG: 3-hydroxyacyl-CoA dehydrogenase NAD-binding domain-containing protein [Clostridium sp.]